MADIPAKITLASTFTCPSPPRIGPTSAVAKLNSRALLDPVFISDAANMKNGTAMIGKLFIPLSICIANSSSGIFSIPPCTTSTTRHVSPMEIATGTPTANRKIITPRNIRR